MTAATEKPPQKTETPPSQKAKEQSVKSPEFVIRDDENDGKPIATLTPLNSKALQNEADFRAAALQLIQKHFRSVDSQLGDRNPSMLHNAQQAFAAEAQKVGIKVTWLITT